MVPPVDDLKPLVQLGHAENPHRRRQRAPEEQLPGPTSRRGRSIGRSAPGEYPGREHADQEMGQVGQQRPLQHEAVGLKDLRRQGQTCRVSPHPRDQPAVGGVRADRAGDQDGGRRAAPAHRRPQDPRQHGKQDVELRLDGQRPERRADAVERAFREVVEERAVQEHVDQSPARRPLALPDHQHGQTEVVRRHDASDPPQGVRGHPAGAADRSPPVPAGPRRRAPEGKTQQEPAQHEEQAHPRVAVDQQRPDAQRPEVAADTGDLLEVNAKHRQARQGAEPVKRGDVRLAGRLVFQHRLRATSRSPPGG